MKRKIRLRKIREIDILPDSVLKHCGFFPPLFVILSDSEEPIEKADGIPYPWYTTRTDPSLSLRMTKDNILNFLSQMFPVTFGDVP